MLKTAFFLINFVSVPNLFASERCKLTADYSFLHNYQNTDVLSETLKGVVSIEVGKESAVSNSKLEITILPISLTNSTAKFEVTQRIKGEEESFSKAQIETEFGKEARMTVNSNKNFVSSYSLGLKPHICSPKT